MIFFEKICFEKRENVNDFWKGYKAKGGNKDALQSGRDRYTAKNYIPLIPLFFSVIKRLFKNMWN